MTIKKVTAKVWQTQRPEVVELAREGLARFNSSQHSGEAISQASRGLAIHMCHASQVGTVFEQALIWFICEGRQTYSKYSCCADVCHTILALLGLWDSRICNRDDDNSDGVIDETEKKAKWKMSQNITILIEGAKKLGKEAKTEIWVPGTKTVKPEPGWFGIVGGSKALGGAAHALVIADVWHPLDGSKELNLISVNGGAVDAGGQCVKLKHHKPIRKKGRWWLANDKKQGGRGLLGWIDVGALVGFMNQPGWNNPAKEDYAEEDLFEIIKEQ